MLLLPGIVKAHAYTYNKYFLQESTDLQTATKDKGQNQPYILICGDLLQPDQLMLVIDNQVICDIEEDDIPFALMSAYYVFNICYVQGCNNVFKFFESSLLNTKTKVPPSVNHFMATLSKQ